MVPPPGCPLSSLRAPPLHWPSSSPCPRPRPPASPSCPPLQVKGNVSKQMVKERFKIFNAMFEEIHRRQSSWEVSDEQLQSELRVSVSAVIAPDKHVKYGPDDLENLFK